MKIDTNTVALVTGAGSGIGKETALALARKGAQLIICDVNQENLNTVEGELNEISKCLLAMMVDVGDRDAMQAFSEQVAGLNVTLTLLMNNAGIGVAGKFLDTPLEEWDRLLKINLYGVVHGCHFFIPQLLVHGKPAHVVNVSSMAGFWPAPGLNAYSTSKFAVFGLTECLRLELRKTNVGTSVICPGIIDTNIVRNTAIHGREDAEVFREKVDKQYQKRNYTPDRVASVIVKAVEGNKAIVPITAESWLAYWLDRICIPLSRTVARLADL